MPDYGCFPMENGNLPNRNPETGIRYGVASLHDLANWLLSETESEYDPICPHCIEYLPDEFESPAPCPHCGEDIATDDEYGDEPSRTFYKDKDVHLEVFDIGVYVYASNVITRARHCSPCCPGAGDLRPPSETAEMIADGSDEIDCYGLPPEFWAENEE